MIRYGRKLREIRSVRGLRQVDVAKELGMSAYSYSSIERGEFLPESHNVIKSLNSTFYTVEERKELKKEHELSKKEYFERQHKEHLKEIDFYESSKRTGKRNEKRLIKKMPGFYEELDSLGDLSKLDVNDKRIQDLREKLTGVRYWKGEG